MFNNSDICNRSPIPTWVPALTSEPRPLLDFDEIFLGATTEQRLTMLIVYADGCMGWTQTVESFLSSEDVLAITREGFHVYALNADDDEQVVLIDGRAYTASQLADMLGIEAYPAFALFGDDGRLLRVLEHPESTEELRLTLENAIALESDIVRLEQSDIYDAPDGYVETLLENRLTPPPPHVLNLKDEAEGRPLAVFFEEPDCHHCDHFRDHILTDPQSRSLLERFRIARYELSSTSMLVTPGNRNLTVAQWGREMGIARAPSVVLFDKAGQRVGQTSDHTDLFLFQSLLDYVTSNAYQSDPSFAHFLRHRAQHLRSHGYEVDVHTH